jgi:hypothetical protein
VVVVVQSSCITIHFPHGSVHSNYLPTSPCLSPLRGTCPIWLLTVYCSFIGSIFTWLHTRYIAYGYTSAKKYSFRAEWLHQSGLAPSEPSKTPRWRITPRPASIQRGTLYIALRSMLHFLFAFCRTPLLNVHSGVVANCDNIRNGFIGYALALGLQCNG